MSIQNAVNAVMLDGKRHTIPELRARLSGLVLDTTISARIRDMRKQGYQIARRRLPGTRLHEYWVEMDQ